MTASRQRLGQSLQRLGFGLTLAAILPGLWLDRFGFHDHAPNPIKDWRVALWCVAGVVGLAASLMVAGSVTMRKVLVPWWVAFFLGACVAWLSFLSGAYSFA